MGARKILVVSLSPLGCIPSQLYKLGSKDGECIASVNDIAVNFNALLADRLHSLRRHLPGALMAYNDAYLAFSNITANAAFHGNIKSLPALTSPQSYEGIQLPDRCSCENFENKIYFKKKFSTDLIDGRSYFLFQISWFNSTVK